MTPTTARQHASHATPAEATEARSRNHSHAPARRGDMPAWLSWWALPAWMTPSMLLMSMLGYAAWAHYWNIP